MLSSIYHSLRLAILKTIYPTWTFLRTIHRRPFVVMGLLIIVASFTLGLPEWIAKIDQVSLLRANFITLEGLCLLGCCFFLMHQIASSVVGKGGCKIDDRELHNWIYGFIDTGWDLKSHMIYTAEVSWSMSFRFLTIVPYFTLLGLWSMIRFYSPWRSKPAPSRHPDWQ